MRMTMASPAAIDAIAVGGIEIADADGNGLPDSPRQVIAVYDYVTANGVPTPDGAVAYEADEIVDEGGFSWQPCQCCESTFGGDRHPAHYIDDDGKINHIEVCVDCLCYLANGDLPETWTQHPEPLFPQYS